MLLALVMILGMAPVADISGWFTKAQAAGETTYVLAGSDFQADSGDSAGIANINGIITQIKAAGYEKMDGFLFAGDYSVNATKTSNVTALKNTILNAGFGLEENDLVLIQGNHDNSASYGGAEAGLVGSVLNNSGANDAGNYGVFVINEKDYNWKGKNETVVKKTAENLKSYLDAKRNAEYTKPIFIISHLPLNYNMRTKNDGDGMYANYIFNVLNEAGEAGLNIIFLFGHDHSNGWDDYLGGSAIYLEKGDKINIAQASQTTWKEETLAFTYMNAGYVGYYRNVNTGSETDLTMTVFEITDDKVEVKRFSKDGLHDVKSKGVTNSYKNESGYSPDTTVYESPQTITLNKEITPAGEEITPPSGGNTGSGTADSIEQVTSLEQGVPYIIVCDRNGLVLTGDATTNKDGHDSLLLSGTASVSTTDLWYYDGTHLIYGDPDSTSSYLLMSTDTAYLGESHSYRMVDDVYLNNDGTTFTLKRTDDGLCLNQYGGGSYTAASPYTSDGNSDAGSKWRIYKVNTSSGDDTVTLDGNWVTITAPISGTTTYIYSQATSITAGQKYVIVGNNHPVALQGTTSMGTQAVTINSTTMTSTTELTLWTFSGSSSGTIYNGTRYLRYNNGFSLNTNATELTFTDNGTNFRIQSGSYSFYYNGSSWTRSSRNSAQYVRLYQLTDKTTTGGTPGLYAMITGQAVYNVENGTSAEDALALVKAGITGYTSNSNTATTGTELQDSQLTWTVDPNYNKDAGGAYTVTIAYNGKTLGTVTVNVATPKISGYSVEPAQGTVNKGASQAAQTGALIYVQLENGKYYTVPVTVGMLTKADGSAVSTGEVDTYENLTVTYNGVKITENFTLNVVAKAGNNYPEYPNEGAVKVNKTGTGIDFQESGLAKVEVSASGVPLKKGADVIVMLDLSSSMDTNKINGVSRLQILRQSLTVLLNQLQADDKDGNPMDIKIAVADFHRYYPDSSSPYYINSADHLTGGSIRTNADGTNKVYTGTRGMGAGAFVDVHDLTSNAFETTNTSNQYYLGYKSGTNYDYAFDAVYQLGEAITAQNTANGEERDLFVIFMSDGAPFQYNYFSAQSGSDSSSTQARYWNNWLQGTMTDDMFASGSNKSYYHPEGKHWMAEAIKGDPAATYPVIRKNNAADTDGDNWVNVNGLGAKMYSIGFCLAKDKEITVESMKHVISSAASSGQYYFEADSADDLSNAFSAIGADIAYAAYNARFVDQMGPMYNLQMKSATYSVVVNGTTVNRTVDQVIEILTYDIYTKAEADAGQIPTGKNIGDRKGTFTVLETVRFSADGTKAYSDQVDTDGDGIKGWTTSADGAIIYDDGDNILADGTKEGFVKGVIYAKSFIYNTNSAAVAVNGVDIPTGKDTSNLTTGSTNVLPSETFYWNMGTVQYSELAMRYNVYLTGSMEGTREAGSYATNEFATLYYDNYLGNPCYKDTVSPVMAWKEANVSYAFYLVDENGNIIVNQTTGETGTFANKIAITKPVVYKTVLLNSGAAVEALEVAALGDGVLPTYYTIYDGAAVYTVTINSNTTGAWNIVKGDGKVNSTYVTQYDPSDASAYSNVLTNSTIGEDYTHTVVWFAVVWTREAHPDTVVVDYGLPVDIHVMTNDMFGEDGELAGIGAYSESLNMEGHDTIIAAGFANEYKANASADDKLSYGDAKIMDKTAGTIRYTLNSMQMNGYDMFAYAVKYSGKENAGYYYDTVTVIPATTIYYEEDFITFSGSNTEWKDAVENYDGSSYTQDEDRPGQYSLTDANNIYGYDSVNNGMSTYSLGNAKMVHVDANSFATASFTFYGTGFDVISMTSNTTGNIAVKVEDASGNAVAKKVVNTYYGYTQVDGQWVATPDTANSLYQVPVLQIENLRYGQYKVTITATYISATDKTSADGYDLYLDAIRIYDPANDGASDGTTDTTIEDAYNADGEGWPSYIELRNKIITAGSFDDIANGALTTDMEGLVFIDGDASVGDAQISDYISYGPNNEVYLAPGQRVAFILSTPENIKNVHIGIKSADGQTGTYTITNIAKAANTETGVKAGDYYNAKTSTISTTTDMYYDLTAWKGDIIVISNTGNMYNTTGVISLTNIKSTYTSNPNGTSTASEGDDTNEVAQANETMVYMTAPAAMLTLRAVNTMYLPEAFEPEKLEVSLNKTQAKVGDKIHVTVTTSDDVEYITVNGEVFTAYKVNRRSGDRIWKTTVQADRAGEMNVDVVAYNAEDIASEAVSETVTVRAKQQPEVIIRDIIKGIIGKIFG